MFIFIDLDDTILDFKKAEAVALKKTLADFSVTATDEIVSLYSAINDKMWKKLEKGENTIILSRSFGKVATLEAVYLLGDFGVVLILEIPPVIQFMLNILGPALYEPGSFCSFNKKPL